jgi:hypothetical protein
MLAARVTSVTHPLSGRLVAARTFKRLQVSSCW